MTEKSKRPATLTKLLKGCRYQYTYATGMRARIEFGSDDVNWEILAGPNKGESGTNRYEARRVGKDIFFLQWHEPEFGTTIALVINDAEGTIYCSAVYPENSDFDAAVIEQFEKQLT